MVGAELVYALQKEVQDQRDMELFIRSYTRRRPTRARIARTLA